MSDEPKAMVVELSDAEIERIFQEWKRAPAQVVRVRRPDYELLERCEEMLAAAQWGGRSDLCPECDSSPSGHAEGCALAALLSDLRKELGK